MAVLLALIATVVLLEICLRIVGPPYYRFNNLSEEYYTNPRGYHEVLRREGKHTVYGLVYRENSRGYRIPLDDDRGSIESPEKWVLGLGDSFTYGRGVRYDDIYLTRLEQLLHQKQARVAVKNCGVVGAGVQDVVDIYARESADLRHGSLVIYGMVLNDFGLVMTEPIRGLNFIDINNGGYTFNPLRKHSAFANFVFHALETRRLHTMTVKAYVESFEGENAEKNFGLLKELRSSSLRDRNTLIIVVFPLLYDFEKYRFRAIHEKIETFCDRNEILRLDLLPAFSSHQAEELWANPTDHHPNEVAHRIAADEISALIEDELPVFLSERAEAAARSGGTPGRTE